MAQACPHCGAQHDPREARCPTTGLPIGGDPKLVGTTLANRYQLVRLLGDGGMGAVYKAADQVLRRFVAIKLLHPAVAQRPAAVERFQREARAAAAIGHPNIIDILDFGVDNRPYMVMEYLRGRSLSQVLAAEGALSIPRACSVAAHALAGLAAAHERGILHRDLKPANLMLVQRFGDKSFVKVCDFGFAALMGPTSAEDGKTLTPARTLVGTPAYASPERLRGDDRRDPRVDIYSIGVVLYEMIAGRRPFDGDTFRELARAVKHDPPPRLSSKRIDVPPQLDEVIQRALAKDPEGRFRNAGEFAAALVPFGGRSIALDDEPSDSFTFEVWQIRQRDSRKKGTRPSIELPHAMIQPPTRPPPVRTGGAGAMAQNIAPVRPRPDRVPVAPMPVAPMPVARGAGSIPPPRVVPPTRNDLARERPPALYAPAPPAPGLSAVGLPGVVPSAVVPPAVGHAAAARPPLPAGARAAEASSPQPARPGPSLPGAPRSTLPPQDRTMRMPALDLAMAKAASEVQPLAEAKPPPPEFDDATAMDDPTVWLDRARLPRSPSFIEPGLPARGPVAGGPGLAGPGLAGPGLAGPGLAGPPVTGPPVGAEARRSPRVEPPPAIAPPAERFNPRIGESESDYVDDATQVSLLVRGKVLLAALRFVARRFGERSVKEVLDTLDPQLRRPFDEGVDPARWYAGEVLTGLAERIDAVHGRDDLHVIVELGRSIAEGAFEDMRRLKPPSPPVELLLSELPRITRSMIQGAETRLRRIGRGYARIELIELAGPSLSLAVLILGFVERSLGRFGAGDVEVNLLSARALDDAETLLDVSWIA